MTKCHETNPFIIATFVWLSFWTHDLHTAEQMYFLDVHVWCWMFQAYLRLRTRYPGKAKARGQRRNTKDFKGLAQESQRNLLDSGYLLLWPEKTHLTKPARTLQGCSAAQPCLMGLPVHITWSHTAQQGLVWLHMVGGFPRCKTIPLKTPATCSGNTGKVSQSS